MIKEYTCLAQLLAAGRGLQNLGLESSRMAPRLYITNTPQNKYIQATQRKQIKTVHQSWKNRDKTLKN